MSHNLYLPQKGFYSLQDTMIDMSWMKTLWKWADKYNINEEILPRNKYDLLKLKQLKLIASFFSFEISEEKKRSKIEREQQAQEYVNALFDSISEINHSTYLPKEIGKMKYLQELCINMSPIESLPDDIVCLQNLEKLCLCHNVNLILTDDQKLWITEMEDRGANVNYDEDLLYRTRWIP